MQDEDIRKLFEEFKPELSPASDFVESTIRKLEGYEEVKSMMDNRLKRSQTASLVAALGGFIFGSLMAFFYPLVQTFIGWLVLSFSNSGSATTPEVINILSWAGISVATVFVTLGSYFSLLPFLQKNLQSS